MEETALEALVALVGGAARAARTVDAALGGPHAVSLVELGLLRAVEESPGQRARPVELVRWVALTPSGVTRGIDRLARRGLLRVDVDETDRRGVAVSLTAAGRRLFTDARASASSAAQRLFRRLSLGQTRQLIRLLEEIG